MEQATFNNYFDIIDLEYSVTARTFRMPIGNHEAKTIIDKSKIIELNETTKQNHLIYKKVKRWGEDSRASRPKLFLQQLFEIKQQICLKHTERSHEFERE